MPPQGVKSVERPEWDQFVDKYAQEYGVDPDLVRSVIEQESQGNPKAVSPKGAQGLMQLMPALSKLLRIEDPLNPEENIRGGVAHLADMLRTYNGDTERALAAYNAGEKAVNEAGGIPNITETKNYVKKIMANYQGQGEGGFAGYSYQGSIHNLPEGEIIPPKKAKSAPLTMERVLAKRDKLAQLPPEVRDVVFERLYDKVVAPREPKALNNQQKGLLRQRFSDLLMGRSPTPDTSKPTTEDYAAQGMSTGAFGQFKSGVMRGLAGGHETAGNIQDWIEKHLPQSMQMTPEQKKFESASQSAIVDPMKSAAGALSEASGAYKTEHPTRAGIAEFTGASLPAMPFSAGMGGAVPAVAKGAPFLTRLGMNVARGAATGATEGPVVFEPTKKGVAEGAGFGAAAPLALSPFGALFRRIMGGAGAGVASKAAPTLTKEIAGASEGTTNVLDTLAQTKFGKKLAELTPDQKIELVNSWREESTKAASEAKKAAKKTTEEAKVEKVKAKEEAKVHTRIQTIKAMDEAKALQKQISAFVKTNKRAPTDEELIKLREQAKAAPVAVATPPSTPAPAAAPPAAPTVPQTVGTAEGAAADTAFFQQAKAALPADASISQIAQKAQELKAAAFKVESPEAVKAVSAVADVSKIASTPEAPKVTVVPEGEHGAGPLGKRASDAERVAAARAKARAEQPEPTAPDTPETILAKKEEEFLALTDEIEAMGPKGKEAAKNLDTFRRKGKITMDQAMEMGQKVLEVLRKQAVGAK